MLKQLTLALCLAAATLLGPGMMNAQDAPSATHLDPGNALVSEGILFQAGKQAVVRVSTANGGIPFTLYVVNRAGEVMARAHTGVAAWVPPATDFYYVVIPDSGQRDYEIESNGIPASHLWVS